MTPRSKKSNRRRKTKKMNGGWKYNTPKSHKSHKNKTKRKTPV